MEHVNDWCFRDIYKGGVWEEYRQFWVSLMKKKTPMDNYLDVSCPVLHCTATNFQEPGCHVI